MLCVGVALLASIAWVDGQAYRVERIAREVAGVGSRTGAPVPESAASETEAAEAA